MSVTMPKRKPSNAKPTGKAPEPEVANLPFSLRLRDDVAEALAEFRAEVARKDKMGFAPPSKPEVIDRALREYLAKYAGRVDLLGHRAGGEDD